MPFTYIPIFGQVRFIKTSNHKNNNTANINIYKYYVNTFTLTFDTLVHFLPKKIVSIYFGALNIRCFKIFLT